MEQHLHKIYVDALNYKKTLGLPSLILSGFLLNLDLLKLSTQILSYLHSIKTGKMCYRVLLDMLTPQENASLKK